MWENEPRDEEETVAAPEDDPEVAAGDESDVEAHGSWAGAPNDAAPSG